MRGAIYRDKDLMRSSLSHLPFQTSLPGPVQRRDGCLEGEGTASVRAVQRSTEVRMSPLRAPWRLWMEAQVWMEA